METITNKKLLRMLRKEMNELREKMREPTGYAFSEYKSWDDDQEYDRWNKAAHDSMRYQQRYISTKAAWAYLKITYNDDQLLYVRTTKEKELVAQVVNYYGLEEGRRARAAHEITWDMTHSEMLMKYY
jgi:hypothetical protein